MLQARVHKSIHSSKDKSGYHTLSAAGGAEEGHEAEQLAIGRDRGHARSTSLDLNKMIASSNVYSDMPAAEPPRPPPVSAPAFSYLLHLFSNFLPSETSG